MPFYTYSAMAVPSLHITTIFHTTDDIDGDCGAAALLARASFVLKSSWREKKTLF